MKGVDNKRMGLVVGTGASGHGEDIETENSNVE